jgi:hypothetical protein
MISFGEGPYYNLNRNIELQDCNIIGKGLFATTNIQKGSIVWCDRMNGPSSKYKKVAINDISLYPEDVRNIIIQYGYQIDEHTCISPLTYDEVNLDYSNYFNHSCNPNVLPLNETIWISVQDIQKGDHLTIDYCTFDSNPYECITECKCGSVTCRIYIKSDDYTIPELQQKYRNNFLPYIKNKIQLQK